MNRRSFLQTAAILGAGATLPLHALAASTRKNPFAFFAGKVPQSDFQARLGIIREAGFREMSLPQGWHRWDNFKDFASLCGKAGVKTPVAYVPVDELGFKDVSYGLKSYIPYLKKLKVKTLVTTAVDSYPHGAKKQAEYLNMYAQMLEWEGISFAYSPNAKELSPQSGIVALDVLRENTEPTLVSFEWESRTHLEAGLDPASALMADNNRFDIWRLNEIKCQMNGDEGMDMAVIYDLWKKQKPAHLMVGHIECPDANATGSQAIMDAFHAPVKKAELPMEEVGG